MWPLQELLCQPFPEIPLCFSQLISCSLSLKSDTIFGASQGRYCPCQHCTGCASEDCGLSALRTQLPTAPFTSQLLLLSAWPQASSTGHEGETKRERGEPPFTEHLLFSNCALNTWLKYIYLLGPHNNFSPFSNNKIDIEGLTSCSRLPRKRHFASNSFWLRSPYLGTWVWPKDSTSSALWFVSILWNTLPRQPWWGLNLSVGSTVDRPACWEGSSYFPRPLLIFREPINVLKATQRPPTYQKHVNCKVLHTHAAFFIVWKYG